MSKLHSPFFGLPLQSTVNVIYHGNLISLKTGARKGLCKCTCSKDDHWIFQPINFSKFCGRNLELLRNFGSRSGSRVKSLKEPFSRSRSLVRSLVPLWKEGLLFVRCSVFLAVISGVCLLVWYGQEKAKSFVEAKLLPSVCSVLSEHIQRDLDFGKVLKISPLSITLESCSVGPHSGEFSCGEASTVKLRVLPFSSLRRGTIVIDAVLSHPSLLVMQKKDSTWLGIPFSEGGLQRHISTEEGIDYRTKTRRMAREEAAAHWARERDDAARQAAEMGYIVSEQVSRPSEVDAVQEDACHSMGLASSESFLCMDERTHWRDHHCMNTGVAYDLKHADMEKSFGVKVPGLGLRFWSRIISVNPRHKFKRKANRNNNSAAGVAAKRRILERSALMACAYFQGLLPGNFDEPSLSTGSYDYAKLDNPLLKIENDANGCTFVVDGDGESIPSASETGVLNIGGEKNVVQGELRTAIGGAGSKGSLESGNNIKQDVGNSDDSTTQLITEQKHPSASVNNISLTHDQLHMSIGRLSEVRISGENMEPLSKVKGVAKTDECNTSNEDLEGAHVVNKNLDKGDECNISNEDLVGAYVVNKNLCMGDNSCGLQEHMVESLDDLSASQGGHKSRGLILTRLGPWLRMHYPFPLWPFSLKSLFPFFPEFLAHSIQKVKSSIGQRVEDIVAGHLDEVQTEGIEKMFPVTLDSVHFKSGTLLLLAYGDNEPREMENVNGHAKFQNHYGRMHVQLSGNCKMWRSNVTSEDGGWLSVDVFIDNVEQKWHANLKVINLFAPLFERILEIPIMWSKGRTSGEVHICMSRGEAFPNLHGQLNVTGLAFQIFDAPSWFSDLSASLCFRGQRIFLHNASGWFGNVPLEASGDFGIHPEEGEFHLMCQVPCVEVNALMKTFKMKPLLFPLAGSVTAVFNCQGPLDAPIFVGSGMVLRKISSSVSDFPVSSASEAIMKNKEAGAVAAFDRVPLSYLSANFTFNTDNCVADLYGIRASLVDGGEIRGAGNAWICPEGEMDDMAMDVNFSGNFSFEKIMQRYLPGHLHLVPLKLGDINGETKLSGSLLRPRFDIKWVAPKAEGSFADARGDIIISHDNIAISSSSVAFELNSKVQTSYPGEYWLNRKDYDVKSTMPLIIDGVELDLRMRGFEFFNFVSSYPFDSPRPVYLKATGRIKFQGNVEKFPMGTNEQTFDCEKNMLDMQMGEKQNTHSLVGDLSLSSLKLNQLMLAPQLAGTLKISHDCVQFNATGKPDESLSVKLVGLLQPNTEENLHSEKMLSFSLQKGQLRTNVCYRPLHYANLEVRHLPLDELEVASLRGTIQRAELQLNIQKRRGHGVLSVLRPKFSGVLGEALDVAARWSGDVITVEKTVLEQSNSRYELQGEYVLPGTRDRNSSRKQMGGLLERAMAGHLGSVISSMGRWRMRLEVPRAEVAEMLPLARLLSRSTDPAVRSRSKDLFIQSLQSVGLYTGSLQDLLEVIREHHTLLDEVILEDAYLPGLSELKGRWIGSLDASGGGNGDTMANFDFRGEDWEWGTYKAQRVVAVGEYSNDDGLHLEKIFIQNDNATIHADGTLLGPKTNLHFAVLNFPVSLVPTLVQVIESSASDAVHSLRQFLAPIKGTLHMEGDLRGSIAKPECDVQVRLLDGAIGGIDLDRAEIVASLTSTSRFLFNAKFVPIIQNGYVHIQGSVPVTFVQNSMLEEEDTETWIPGWAKERAKGPVDESEKKISRDRNEEGWDIQLAESLKGLNWNILDVGEVRIDADIKDGGMMMLTALSPYADWLHGNADIMLQVRGTVEQPVLDGSASFHRASVSSPVLRKPLTNLGGTVHVKSNRLCISSLESRVGRRGKLFIKGNLPLRTSEASLGDKIDLKCEVLEVRAKNILSGQVDTQMQITGSILQPNISGNIKLSYGEAYLPPDKGTGAVPFNRLASVHRSGGYNPTTASRYLSWFPSSEPSPSSTKFPQPSGKQTEVEKEMEQVSRKPKIDIRLTDLKLVLGPELRILYPLILDFTVSGELELNGIAHPKLIKPKGILTFENGEVNLVATQVRLKKEHLNSAKFEPDNGLDPSLDLALVGSEWQFRIQSRASNWQDNLVVTSTRSVEQDVLSPTEAARVFESQLAESILEVDGKLAFKKLATATLETLMPRIEGKGEFGQARWRIVYAPQIFSLLSVDPTIDPLKSLASNISFGTEVEIKLGKRLQASVVRQMKDSEMAMQFTLIYQLTNRLRVLLQSWSASSQRLLFEYSSTS